LRLRLKERSMPTNARCGSFVAASMRNSPRPKPMSTTRPSGGCTSGAKVSSQRAMLGDSPYSSK